MINTMLQTSMGDIYFDAVFKTDHSANMMVTEHPVQTGAPIADHAYLEPEEISCEIGMTDVNGDGMSVQMYQQLRELMSRREPFTLVTRLHSYPNMLITALSVPDDYTTMFALKAGIVFKQVRVVQVATIQVQQTVSASKSEAASPSSGKQNQTQSQAKSKQTDNGTRVSVAKEIKDAVTVKTTKSAITCTAEEKTITLGTTPKLTLTLTPKIDKLISPPSKK